MDEITSLHNNLESSNFLSNFVDLLDKKIDEFIPIEHKNELLEKEIELKKLEVIKMIVLIEKPVSSTSTSTLLNTNSTTKLTSTTKKKTKTRKSIKKTSGKKSILESLLPKHRYETRSKVRAMQQQQSERTPIPKRVQESKTKTPKPTKRQQKKTLKN